MQFLADESYDFTIVRALSEAGHDVVAVAEGLPRAEDPSVLMRAVNEGRVLLTEDKDFGQLVYSSAQPSARHCFLPLSSSRAGRSGESSHGSRAP